jgi:putative membrane protein
LGLRGLAALALLVLLGSFALSIAATAVAFWDFTLVAAGPTLDVRRGLLEQRHDTLPLRRLQALRVEENLARRVLGLAAVKVDVAGRADRDEARQTSVLLPLGTRAEAFSLVERLIGDLAGVRARSPVLTGMPRRAATRRVTRALAWAFVPAGLVAVAHADRLLAFAVLGGLLIPALALALASYRSLGWALGWEGRVLVTRCGVLVRRTAFVPLGRVQSLALRASPWQRRRRLASLQVQIARSPGTWSDPRAVDLDAGVARGLLAGLAGALASGLDEPPGRRAADPGSPAAGARSVQAR